MEDNFLWPRAILGEGLSCEFSGGNPHSKQTWKCFNLEGENVGRTPHSPPQGSSPFLWLKSSPSVRKSPSDQRSRGSQQRDHRNGWETCHVGLALYSKVGRKGDVSGK